MKNILRNLSIIILLALGGFLIAVHTTLLFTLLGFVFWCVAIVLSLQWLKAGPEIKVFSSSLPSPNGLKNWGPVPLFLAGLLLLLSLGASQYFLKTGYWSLLFFGVLIAGIAFFFLERHSSAFWSFPAKGKSWFEKYFFFELLILFFCCFYYWLPFLDKSAPYLFSTGGDCTYSFSLAANFAQQAEPNYTTPYIDVWWFGQCAFSYFWAGMFMRLFGISPYIHVFFNFLVNVLGLVFFFKFLCFYVSRRPALAATLLLAASHWSVYYIRQTYTTVEFIMPLLAATFYFFARALEFGKARDFALLGTLLAFDLMSHVIIHFCFLYVIFILLWILATPRRSALLKQRSAWFFAFGVCLLWYLPMFLRLQQHGPSLGFFTFDLFKYYNVWNGQGAFPWTSFTNTIQMFFLPSQSIEMCYLPYLSPWEGLLLIAGLTYSLWRFYQPAFLILLIGFLAGIAPDAITGGHEEPHRAIAALPFIYLFVGIGLDRLEKTLLAPLPSNGKTWIGHLFLLLFFVFSLIWQYDVLFKQFPRNKAVYANQTEVFIERIMRDHPAGWDVYPELGPGDCLVKDIQLPLKNIPAKGAVIFLDDVSSQAYRDWITLYYPQAVEKIIDAPTGEVVFRLWEISPAQIQQALQNQKKLPTTGLLLSWYDSQSRLLGSWHIPVLSAKVLNPQWFQYHPGKTTFPWEKTSYFTVKGVWENPHGKPVALWMNGKVTGTLDGRPLRFATQDQYPVRFNVGPFPHERAAVNLTYVPTGHDFALTLEEQTPAGWAMVPTSQLKE